MPIDSTSPSTIEFVSLSLFTEMCPHKKVLKLALNRKQFAALLTIISSIHMAWNLLSRSIDSVSIHHCVHHHKFSLIPVDL